MNDTAPRDPLDELRRANPVAADGLPPNSRDRLWSRIEEARMTNPNESRIPRWTIAASGVLAAAALVAAFAVSGSPSPAPTASDPGSGGGGLGMCLAFSIEELQARDFAFDGTVTAIDGDQATFAVNTAFWGVDSASITLTGSTGMLTDDGVALDGGPRLVVGERYLVSGDDDFAWGCGYSVVYDEATAATWAAAAP